MNFLKKMVETTNDFQSVTSDRFSYRFFLSFEKKMARRGPKGAEL